MSLHLSARMAWAVSMGQEEGGHKTSPREVPNGLTSAGLQTEVRAGLQDSAQAPAPKLSKIVNGC